MTIGDYRQAAIVNRQSPNRNTPVQTTQSSFSPGPDNTVHQHRQKALRTRIPCRLLPSRRSGPDFAIKSIAGRQRLLPSRPQEGKEAMWRYRLYSFLRRKLKIAFFTFMCYAALC
ncbi:MAG: hypothetical protein V3W34_03825 [Phycisphaerae bacterium]